MDSRKHLLDFFPSAPRISAVFAVQDCFWNSLNPNSKKNGPSLILLTSKCSYFHRCLFQAVNAICPLNPRNTYVWTRYIVTI